MNHIIQADEMAKMLGEGWSIFSGLIVTHTSGIWVSNWPVGNRVMFRAYKKTDAGNVCCEADTPQAALALLNARYEEASLEMLENKQ